MTSVVLCSSNQEFLTGLKAPNASRYASQHRRQDKDDERQRETTMDNTCCEECGTPARGGRDNPELPKGKRKRDRDSLSYASAGCHDKILLRQPLPRDCAWSSSRDMYPKCLSHFRHKKQSSAMRHEHWFAMSMCSHSVGRNFHEAPKGMMTRMTCGHSRGSSSKMGFRTVTPLRLIIQNQ